MPGGFGFEPFSRELESKVFTKITRSPTLFLIERDVSPSGRLISALKGVKGASRKIMQRILLKARSYNSPMELEIALRETVRSLGIEDESAGVVQCQSCHGWFVVEPDEITAEDSPVRKGRFWQINACDECRA